VNERPTGAPRRSNADRAVRDGERASFGSIPRHEVATNVGRPSIRFLGFQTGLGAWVGNSSIAVKIEAQQAAAGVHRARDLLMRQHTMLRNQLRGLMAEFGIVAAKGTTGSDELLTTLAEAEDRRIPSPLREGLLRIAETLRGIDRRLERTGRSWRRAAGTRPAAT
jgi:transposase